MKNKIRSILSALVLLYVAFGLASTPASASHLRGTTVSWSPTGAPGQVQFTLQYAQRLSAGCYPSYPCVVGSALSIPFNFGDGGYNTYVTGIITSVNTAEDWFSATATFTHTYSGAGPYIAYYEVCCRISTIISGHDQNLRMETSVSPRANPANHSPVVSMPAIISVPLQPTTGFLISASDFERDALTYRLSNASEMYGAGSFSCAEQEPPGIGVNSAGQVTWDTTKITQAGCGFPAPAAGQLWTAQFMVEDLDTNGNVKSKVPLDVILKFVSSTEAPPTLTLSNPGPITVQAGTTISFTATGNDAAPNSRVTLNATGLPVGATSTNLNQALLPPVTSTFTWTPTASQGGNYVITYSATNDTLEQVLSSVSIFVQNVLPPVARCPASLTAQYNTAVSIPVQVSDPQADALSVVWTVDGTAVHTDSVAATNATTSLSLSQTFAALGAHTVGITATDTDNQSASCSTPVTVNPAPQTISFSALPNVTYGDPDTALSATATSGLAVSFTAAGNCSIVGGAVHAIGIGSCSVTAAQEGNSDYLAAPSVTQQFTIAPHNLTVTAQSVSRQYGVANPAFTGAINGVVNNDAITATYSTSATPASPVGTYAIVPALSGAALSNYTVTSNDGTLTVTAAPLTVTAADASRNYGSANPAFTGIIAGILNNDAITATYSTSATAASSVGTYSIVPVLSGAALSNYTVTSNNGTLTVSPVPLIVTPANANRTYGSPNPAFTGTITGLVNSDSITAAYSTTATTSSNVGTYPITAKLNDPSGKLGNYNVTLNTGTLTIDKANQTIAWATPAAITYATPLSGTQLNATVSVPGPSAAGAVTYSPAAGAVLDAGTQTLTVSVAETTNYNPATASVFLVVNKAQPSFSGLSSPTIVYRTGSATIRGVLAAPTAIPAGQQVAITLNNVSQNAVLDSDGSFSTTFNTASLPVAANGYTVSYSYPGSLDFNAASASSKLTVAYSVCYLYDTAQVKKSGSTYPIKVAVCDANNQSVGPNFVLTAVGWGVTSPAVSPVPDAGNSNGNGTFRNLGSGFMWNLQTTNMNAGNYNMFFTISGDPTLHFAPFAVR